MARESSPISGSLSFVWRDVQTPDDVRLYVETIRNKQEDVYSILDVKRAERMVASSRFVLRIGEDKASRAVIAFGVLVPYRSTPIVIQIGAVNATLDDAVVAGADEMKRVLTEISERNGKRITSYRISAILGKCSSVGIIPALRDLPLSDVKTSDLADDTVTVVEIGVRNG